MKDILKQANIIYIVQFLSHLFKATNFICKKY